MVCACKSVRFCCGIAFPFPHVYFFRKLLRYFYGAVFAASIDNNNLICPLNRAETIADVAFLIESDDDNGKRQRLHEVESPECCDSLPAAKAIPSVNHRNTAIS